MEDVRTDEGPVDLLRGVQSTDLGEDLHIVPDGDELRGHVAIHSKCVAPIDIHRGWDGGEHRSGEEQEHEGEG